MGIIAIGIVVHIIFALSIFDIYFTTPIIHGMTPQKSDTPAPAKRLVLIVADGLRAENLYGDNLLSFNKMKENAPFLSSVILNNSAAWGISHTRVPTESRPGHVALAAGIYEDPSAIAKGWKENPVEFDSVFNESRYTWAWGSPDIVPMFAKSNNVHAECYDAEQEDFSGKFATYILDYWVFNKVETLFSNVATEKLRNDLHQDKIIFFLHLLGLDTAGHTHKPYSIEHTKNLKAVDEGIERVQANINSFYNDDQTVFVFTADHGMTNWGSHGAGSKHETETPFIAWGAGIAPTKKPVEIEQADIAPFISTLIGIPFPVNSIGILPVNCLNMSEESIVNYLYANARQIYAQYNEKHMRTKQNYISLFHYPFPDYSDKQFLNLHAKIQIYLKERKYNDAKTLCMDLINISKKGLDYYQNYHQGLLLKCISVAYIGWITLLFIHIYGDYNKSNSKMMLLELWTFFNKGYDNKIQNVIQYVIILTMIITSTLLYAQSFPIMYYIYFNLTLYILMEVTHKITEVIPKINSWKFSSYTFIKSLCTIIFYVVGIEALVMCFFERAYLSIVLVLIAFWPYSLSKINIVLKYVWTVICLCLAVFPCFPVVGSTFSKIIIVSAAILWITLIFSLQTMEYMGSPQKKLINNKLRYWQISMSIFYVFILILAVYNLMIVDDNFTNKIGLTYACQITSCVLSVVSILSPFFGSHVIIHRLVNIMMSLIIPFILLSVNYEPLFLYVLSIALLLWLIIEYYEFSPFNKTHIMKLSFNMNQLNIYRGERTKINAQDFRRGFFILLFTVLAFFGMGNIASINSFDPMWVRNFMTVFSPFTMTALILFKILIPYIIISCVFRAVVLSQQVAVIKIFLIVLMFCDIMGMHFLYLVTNVGSWLEIGSSISHFVIVQVMVLFLLLLYVISDFLTKKSITIGETEYLLKTHWR